MPSTKQHPILINSLVFFVVDLLFFFSYIFRTYLSERLRGRLSISANFRLFLT